MAQQANMSEGHFSRTVKRVFGSTPMEFLTNYRLSQAVHLIETTGWNLGDIADESGFSNINRFTENFKKAFNCTPLKYRNNLKQESNNIRP
jgi:AraC-like DNA-binding protein